MTTTFDFELRNGNHIAVLTIRADYYARDEGDRDAPDMSSYIDNGCVLAIDGSVLVRGEGVTVFEVLNMAFPDALVEACEEQL